MKGAIRQIIPLAKRLWKSTHRRVSKMSVGFFVVHLAMGIVLLMAPCAWAKTIHVPADSSTIQAGIDGAVDGDTVLVADGVYTGGGNKNIDFLGKAIVVQSENGPEETVIDCEKTTRAFFFQSNETVDSKLVGFTIQNGYAYRSSGGGILCEDASPTIHRCILRKNRASHYGGGMYLVKSSACVVDCILTDNSCSSYHGGGIACSQAAPSIENCIITENQAVWGGGIYSSSSSPGISNCLISNNLAAAAEEALGGGIFCDNGFVSNCLIVGNRVGIDSMWGWLGGGGIYCSHSVSLTFINCTISKNIVQGINCDNASPYLVNCIIWNNQGTELALYHAEPLVSYSDIQGSWAGEGNIDEDPLFRDPENGDFHLKVGYCGHMVNSPCVDRGDPTIFDEITDCEHGLGTTRSDMGAYGGSNAGWPTAVEEKEEIASVPEKFMLFQNYPNPFNSETVLRYSLSQSGPVTLSVYNVLGQRVATLLEVFREAGEHCFVWDAASFSSGIYFARLETVGHTKTIKMVLLR